LLRKILQKYKRLPSSDGSEEKEKKGNNLKGRDEVIDKN